MIKLFFLRTSFVIFIFPIFNCVQAQEIQLKLSEAVATGLKNYQNISAKRNYYNSSVALVKNVRNQYLPDVTASIQQAYGTVNGQLGPYGAFGVSSIGASGPAYTAQNWTAAFGSIYVINTNWEIISFGRLQSRINAANKQALLDSANLTQEKFIDAVKISGAYLNLLIAQRFVRNAKFNVDRAGYVQQTVVARVKSGLNPGVDSSIANADLSSAKLVLIQSVSNEQQSENQLSQLININPSSLGLDSDYFANTPTTYTTNFPVAENPQVKFYKSRIDESNSLANYIRNSVNPGLNLFGAFQGKASGFDYNYTPDFSDRYSKSYFDGINPSRFNYVLGLGITWNVISPIKVKQQAKAQDFLTAAYQDEYDLVSTQLKDQLILADQQIENSIKSVHEAPIQYKAASDAYIQKTVLYKNGLTNIVDVQQALYALNRAETDMSVSYINVWQALLLKAASSGDFDLFLKQVK